MKKSFFQRIKVKLKLFRILVHTLIRALLLIFLVLMLIYILIISIPELLGNITNFLMGLSKNVINSITGLYEHIISSLINAIMQEQVISRIRQTVTLVSLLIAFSFIFFKISKIADWVKPFIPGLAKNEIKVIVFFNMGKICWLFAKYNKQKRKITDLNKEKNEIKREINRVSNIINNYEKRELVFQEKYCKGPISRTSELEQNILLCKISKVDKRKKQLQNQCESLKTEISKQEVVLEKNNQEARAIIVDKMHCYYYKIYKKCVWLKNKLIDYLKELPLIIYKGIISAFTKLI